MDAKIARCVAFCAIFLSAALAEGANFATTNFVVTAPTEEMARKVANCAEFWRRDLAVQWLGEPLPNWYRPCPISVKVGQIGAGGQTTFTFENGEVFGWKMQVQGTLERILDSVIPHEVNHTVFASYFRRPLPRWADEGAATLFEHESEQARQMDTLNRVLTTSRRIPLKQLLTLRDYPHDPQDVLTLYAEGYSLAGYLVGSKGQDGRAVYLKFLHDANQMGWEDAIQRHYGYRSIDELEQRWTGWIVAGSPPFTQPAGQLLAQGTQPDGGASEPKMVVRSQSPQEAVAVPVAATAEEPAPMRAIPRTLRDERQPNAARPTSVLRTAEVPVAHVESELTIDSQPFSMRRPERLSPTAEGIHTDPKSRSYTFPESR